MSKNTEITSDIIDNVQAWGTVAAGLSVITLSADTSRLGSVGIVLVAWLLIVVLGSIVARKIIRLHKRKESDHGEREEFQDEQGNHVIQYYSKK